MRTVIEYGFGPLALHSIEAVVVPENERMLRVLKKLGFGRHPPLYPDQDLDPREDAELWVLVCAERTGGRG